MSKEMTPKDALDELCDLATPNGDCLNYVIGLSGIILKALDRLELLEKENKGLKNKNASLKIKVRAWEIQGEKFKRVIEILKDKANIRLHILTNTDGSKIYEIEFILGYYSIIYEITQQEYDLLKEVLENV